MKLSFLSSIKEKAEKSVGLDIGSFSVKAIELARGKNGYELLGFGCRDVETSRPTPLSESVDKEGGKPVRQAGKEGQSKEAVAAAVRELWEKENIGTTTVRTSLSGDSVIVRYIQLPRMSKQELTSAINFEAEKHIPFKREDVAIDFQILEEINQKDKNKMRVLLVAAKKEAVARRIALIKECKLQLEAIDVDSFALLNSFQAFLLEDNASVIGLVNIGDRTTNINIVKAGLPFFTRDISIGGSDVNRAIRVGLGLPLEKIEGLKHNLGERRDKVFEVISPVLENLAGQLHLSFDFAESQAGSQVDKVYLSGGGALLQGLDSFLGKNLGLAVDVWDPLESLAVKPEMKNEDLRLLSPRLAVAIGLAMRDI